MRAGFEYLWKDVDVWLPLSFTADQRSDASRHSNNWVMIARLKTGASVDQAQREIDGLNARNDERFPQFRNLIRDGGYRTVVVPLQEEVVRDVRATLYLLWAGALFVLLIGVVNLANLFLMRSASRWRELATRHAIGASVARVGRQVLTETTLLAACGGVMGLAAGWWVLRLVTGLDLDVLPRSHEIGLDWQAAGAMLTLAAAVGVATGLIPLVRLSRVNVTDVLRDAGRGSTAATTAGRLRRLLATAQVALAFMLLIGAALLLASFRAVLAIDPGFEPAGVVTAAISLPSSAYRDASALATGRRPAARAHARPSRRRRRRADDNDPARRELQQRHHSRRGERAGRRRIDRGAAPDQRERWLLRSDAHPAPARAILRPARQRLGAAGGHRRRATGAAILAWPRRRRPDVSSGPPIPPACSIS